MADNRKKNKEKVNVDEIKNITRIEVKDELIREKKEKNKKIALNVASIAGVFVMLLIYISTIIPISQYTIFGIGSETETKNQIDPNNVLVFEIDGEDYEFTIRELGNNVRIISDSGQKFVVQYENGNPIIFDHDDDNSTQEVQLPKIKELKMHKIDYKERWSNLLGDIDRGSIIGVAGEIGFKITFNLMIILLTGLVAWVVSIVIKNIVDLIRDSIGGAKELITDISGNIKSSIPISLDKEENTPLEEDKPGLFEKIAGVIPKKKVKTPKPEKTKEDDKEDDLLDSLLMQDGVIDANVISNMVKETNTEPEVTKTRRLDDEDE